MDGMIPIWYGVLLGLATAYFGFWFGRSRNWGLLETVGEGTVREETGEGTKGKRETSVRGDMTGRKILPQVRYLASPSSGTVENIREEGNLGARILTTDSKLYSPSAGRVLSIAPRGNAFLIMTDWGTEVEVRACTSEDDLLDRYFRPRVIRGEIIRRGKLLLEYDREKLDRECEDTAVYLMAKGERTATLEPAGESEVKTGDALFWVDEVL